MQRASASARRPGLVAATLVALLAAGRAHAQDATAPRPWAAGEDVVQLRDGHTLAGRAIDVRRGDQVTLRLRLGGLRVLLWSELLSAHGPAFTLDGPTHAVDAPVPIEQPAESTFDGPSPLKPRSGAVPVRLLSEGDPLAISGIRESWLAPDPADEMGLDSIAASSTNALGEVPGQPALRDAFHVRVHMRRLCATPCTLYLRPGSSVLHVGGPGRIESLERIAVGRRGQLVVLRSASALLFGGGVAITLAGSVAGVVGGIALLLATEAPASTPIVTRDPSLPLAAGVALGSAVVALAVGIPMIVAARVGVARSRPLEPGTVRF